MCLVPHTESVRTRSQTGVLERLGVWFDSSVISDSNRLFNILAKNETRNLVKDRRYMLDIDTFIITQSESELRKIFEIILLYLWLFLIILLGTALTDFRFVCFHDNTWISSLTVWNVWHGRCALKPCIINFTAAYEIPWSGHHNFS